MPAACSKQRRLAGAPLELAAILVAVAEVAAQAPLQQLARQHEGRGAGAIRRPWPLRDDAAGDGGAGDGIDDEERAGRRIVGERIDGNRAAERDRGDGDVVDAAALSEGCATSVSRSSSDLISMVEIGARSVAVRRK